MSRQIIISCDICKNTIPQDKVVTVEVPTGETLSTLRASDIPELDTIRVDVCPTCISNQISNFLVCRKNATESASIVDYHQIVRSLLGDSVIGILNGN